MTVNTVGYTYNDFGRVTADNRSGNAADISYAYDDLHGWQKSIKSAGGFEQKLYHGSSSFVDGVEDGDDEYVYAADGTRLRAVHSRKVGNTWLKDSTDYCGSLILQNGAPGMYQFTGGYISFSNSALSGCHYYIQDYLGNNRMVVNKTGAVEQTTHYYPYGGIIGGIDQNPSFQKYKFGGKELDRSYGLDWYDVQARLYDPVVPSWHTIDPLAEKYYWISPYAYCAGNPVNAIDLDGRNPVYSANGILIANTREGFTGQIYVYTGSENLKFEDMTMDELLNLNNPDLMTYDKFASSHSSNALSGFVSNVMTDIMQHFDGVNILGTKFDMSTLFGGKVYYYDSRNNNSNFSSLHLNDKIIVSANRTTPKNYEATVENLASTLIFHEWYGHGIRRFGKYHINGNGYKEPNHYLVYKIVMNYNPLYRNTTDKYKAFYKDRYDYYFRTETVR